MDLFQGLRSVMRISEIKVTSIVKNLVSFNFISAECIESDVIYTGFPLKDKTTGTNNYGPTSDGLACQTLCQKTKGCQWFNWDMGECWLKTQKGTKKEKPGSSTGPKTCPSTS